MKVIKQGNLESLKETKKFECYSCGCIFEADREEYEIGQQYNQFYCSCECPTCNRPVSTSY